MVSFHQLPFHVEHGLFTLDPLLHALYNFIQCWFHIIRQPYQTTAVTSRWRRRCVSSNRLVMARTAAQVADLPNQHPRHDRHYCFFRATRRCCDVLLLYFRSIYHRFTRSRWNSRALSSGDPIEATFSNARQHSLWERARCCYRRHRGGGRGHVYQSATHALRQLLPVLKMSRTDTTNSSSVNRDCFVTFRRTSGYVLWR